MPRRSAGAMGARHRDVARDLRHVAARCGQANRPVAGPRAAHGPSSSRTAARGLAASGAGGRAAGTRRARGGTGTAVRRQRALGGRRVRGRCEGPRAATRVPRSGRNDVAAAADARGTGHRARRICGRRLRVAARGGAAGCGLLSGAGSRELFVHAVDGDRLGRADRGVGAGRCRRAPRRPCAGNAAAVGRPGGGLERSLAARCGDCRRAVAARTGGKPRTGRLATCGIPGTLPRAAGRRAFPRSCDHRRPPRTPLRARSRRDSGRTLARRTVRGRRRMRARRGTRRTQAAARCARCDCRTVGAGIRGGCRRRRRVTRRIRTLGVVTAGADADARRACVPDPARQRAHCAVSGGSRADCARTRLSPAGGVPASHRNGAWRRS